MVMLQKKYESSENCNLLKVPRVKKKTLDAINKNPYSDDLNQQVIQTPLATRMIPLAQMANMLVNKKQLELVKDTS